ncbi:MAG TPA: arginine deiminase-related protein [Chitinophagaceae bacterium]|nr:arginine deiminase-related protein [Chitinophagaceae bacterium]
MIRPAAFGFNKETAADNFFQSDLKLKVTEIQQKALAEFDNMAQLLREHEIDVIVFEDTPDPIKPSAVFPNNWLSTSPDGKIFTYPMLAQSRRLERRQDIITDLSKNYKVNEVQGWSHFEKEDRFLEGTGSMVMDHENKMIYAAISERTNISVLEKFAATNGYQAVVFLATDKNSKPIYHTNVMMTLGDEFCVLCEDAIEEEWELIAIRQLLESTEHAIIPITREQMHAFAGNMLQVKNIKGEKYIVLSQTAFKALRREQKEMLEAFAKLLPVDVSTIEQVEGGSVRCMMAEVFLERR